MDGFGHCLALSRWLFQEAGTNCAASTGTTLTMLGTAALSKFLPHGINSASFYVLNRSITRPRSGLMGTCGGNTKVDICRLNLT